MSNGGSHGTKGGSTSQGTVKTDSDSKASTGGGKDGK